MEHQKRLYTKVRTLSHSFFVQHSLFYVESFPFIIFLGIIYEILYTSLTIDTNLNFISLLLCLLKADNGKNPAPAVSLSELKSWGWKISIRTLLACVKIIVPTLYSFLSFTKYGSRESRSPSCMTDCSWLLRMAPMGQSE